MKLSAKVIKFHNNLIACTSTRSDSACTSWIHTLLPSSPGCGDGGGRSFMIDRSVHDTSDNSSASVASLEDSFLHHRRALSSLCFSHKCQCVCVCIYVVIISAELNTEYLEEGTKVKVSVCAKNAPLG